MTDPRSAAALRRLELQTDRERLAAWMTGRHATASQMMAALGVRADQLKAVVRTMRAQGTIARVDDTHWALTGSEPKPRAPRRETVAATPDGAPRVRQVQARQLGLERDPWTAALFGPRGASTSDTPAP